MYSIRAGLEKKGERLPEFPTRRMRQRGQLTENYSAWEGPLIQEGRASAMVDWHAPPCC